jgi:hypothetical protein
LNVRKIIVWIAVIVLIVAVIGVVAWYSLLRRVPGPFDAPDVPIEAYYKYGSIGTEGTVGVPYWIWLVLPRIFPEYLPGPGGYTALGMVWEEGVQGSTKFWEQSQGVPVGITKVDLGIVPRAGINCALCHSTTYRKSADQVAPTFVPGGPAQRFDLLGYQTFLFMSASDPRFTSDVILEQINIIINLTWYEELLYRYIMIPGTRKALLEQKELWSWVYRNPAWGPGRIDPFNPVKFGNLKQPVDTTIGNSDMMAVWELKLRAGTHLHTDGLNTSIREVTLSSALGDGATPKSLDLAVMERIENYLLDLPAPEYPYEIDDSLASAGGAIFESQCADCHDPIGQGRNGQVIPIDEIGTDRHRLDMWMQKDADAYNATYSRYPWGLHDFQDNEGYVAIPLTGLWLRAPYLHNGSVPSLQDMLEVPKNRTKVFYRGYDVYDPDKVGFISDKAQVEQNGVIIEFFRYDTSLPGNSNEGHLFGTDLSPADKEALIEYLKTL